MTKDIVELRIKGKVEFLDEDNNDFTRIIKAGTKIIYLDELFYDYCVTGKTYRITIEDVTEEYE